jgi:hypothetical protein
MQKLNFERHEMKQLGLKFLAFAFASVLLSIWSGSSAAQSAPSYWMACTDWQFPDRLSNDSTGFTPNPDAATKGYHPPTDGRNYTPMCSWFDRPVSPQEAKLKFWLGRIATERHTPQQIKDLKSSSPPENIMFLLVHREGDSLASSILHIDDWNRVWPPPSAPGQTFYMSCNGGLPMVENDFGFFRVVSSLTASAKSANTSAPGPGQCAWLDRPLNPEEARLPLVASQGHFASKLRYLLRFGKPFYMLVSRGALPSGIPGSQGLLIHSVPSLDKPVVNIPKNVVLQPGATPPTPTNAPATGKVILQPGALPGAFDANSSGKNRKIYWGN